MEDSKLSGTDIEKITAADDFHIAPLRHDGKTFGTPTWIWSVTVSGNLYVRAYHGVASRWHKAAVNQKKGKIRSAGLEKTVRFETVTDENLTGSIDQAYRQKYSRSPYLQAMISETARAATIKIVAW